MTSKNWCLLLSLLSLAVIFHSYFVNVNLTRQSLQCLNRLSETMESGDELQKRLNKTEDLATQRELLADEIIIQTARKKAEREQLLETLKELQTEKELLKIKAGEIKMAETIVQQKHHRRENINKYIAHLQRERASLLEDIKKTKDLLRIVQEKGNIEENGGAGAEGNKTVAA
ncbi:uncharacterized protein LOC110986305 isoform X1 [Acanthaster planci]|uniref:Uncharacterized protein LOC110986305 isoform X1 n=1 Tax=Acanthaster planci TaxID=133434 RepID=A0A8B7ZKC0_ACAPL|nr:uncharacterized protein LOC110986305 isoform X1 [Acanthaster planci]